MSENSDNLSEEEFFDPVELPTAAAVNGELHVSAAPVGSGATPTPSGPGGDSGPGPSSGVPSGGAKGDTDAADRAEAGQEGFGGAVGIVAAVDAEGEDPKQGKKHRRMERDVMGALVETGVASSSLSMDDIQPDPAKVQGVEESDFVVKNLDTGEMFSIQEIEARIPQALDPISLRCSSEPPSDPQNAHTDERASKPPKRKAKRIVPSDGNEKLCGSDPDFVKVVCHKKLEKQMNSLFILQRLTHHTGAIWTFKASTAGQYLASGGQDMVVRVWVLDDDPSRQGGPFKPKPFRIFYGHTADVLFLSWSTNNFLLSSSMDKTVRLWHVSKAECLCVFQHVDFVTCCSFHPQDDKYFMSGSLDEKLRLWNIPGKRVVNWVETHGLITAGAFSHDGKVVMTGSYKGMCNFYETQGLNLLTSLHVHSTRGKNKRGKKITGIEVMPAGNLILITSNDSRLRLYHANDYSLHCKFKGLENYASQIKANVSESGRSIICGSEDKNVFLWPAQHVGGGRRDRCEAYESFCVSKTLVTVASFVGLRTAKLINPEFDDESVIIAANYGGVLTVLCNDRKRAAALAARASTIQGAAHGSEGEKSRT